MSHTEAAMELFRDRLLRKAYRPGRRPADCPEDVYACEKGFLQLLQGAIDTQPMDRLDWHSQCNAFSDAWEHICHWVHPSRLADFLTEQEELEWVGEYPIRPEAGKSKIKVKSNVKAQRFKCPECNVECNSYAQYTIHAQGNKHLEMVEQVRKNELRLHGRNYVSPGAVPLDTEAGQGASPQAYFKRDHDAPATPEKQVLAPKPSPSTRPALMTTYATFLAMSTVSMAATEQPYAHQDGDYYEPTHNSFGCWGQGCNSHSPYCMGVMNEPAEAVQDYDDDDEEKDKEEHGSSLNPGAAPFLGGRSYSLPTHDRWSDDSESGSTMESTPAHSTTRSSLSDSDDEIGRIVELIDLEVQFGNARGPAMSELRAADAHTLSAALIKSCARHSPASLGNLINDIASDDLNEVMGADLIARLAAGPTIAEETEFMGDLEAAHIDAMNTREAVAYSGALGLGMALCCVSALSADTLTTMLEQYTKNITSAELIPQCASDLILAAAANLGNNTKIVVPPCAAGTPRRLRHILSTLA